MPGTEPRGAFVPVNGLRMYMEEHGQGDPLLLIHGGVVHAGMWRTFLPELAASSGSSCPTAGATAGPTIPAVPSPTR
jgi:hypothetical protein